MSPSLHETALKNPGRWPWLAMLASLVYIAYAYTGWNGASYLAGEIADGVIFNFFPPERVKAALGELREGAAKAGRDVRDVVSTLFATAFISNDVEAARWPARTLLSRYGAMPFYGNMLAAAGFEREMSGIRSARIR